MLALQLLLAKCSPYLSSPFEAQFRCPAVSKIMVGIKVGFALAVCVKVCGCHCAEHEMRHDACWHAGDVFVKPELRQGILPRILAGLLKARAATRAELKKTSELTQQAVLDSRQKALKVCPTLSPLEG